MLLSHAQYIKFYFDILKIKKNIGNHEETIARLERRLQKISSNILLDELKDDRLANNVIGRCIKKGTLHDKYVYKGPRNGLFCIAKGKGSPPYKRYIAEEQVERFDFPVNELHVLNEPMDVDYAAPYWQMTDDEDSL